MIESKFKEQVEKGLGCAVILAGSGSDEPHLEKLVNSLDKYGIPFEVRVVSAHKQNDKLLEIIGEYDSWNGPLAYIAVAGGTDALSGTVSYHSFRPTISCPPDDLNRSCLTNPSGSSNAYIIKTDNVARFVAQMFSNLNPNYREIIIKEISKKKQDLESADLRLREKYEKSQNRE